ncbi:MAG: M24 family metallopeptidase, partial [Candidatus Diapherotrites archaeon]|nr:M24 family metallopeptidase [Candidatus Diapherotrites archaeon]
MKKQEFECYIKAGKIATKVKANARKHAKVGMKLLDLAECIEKEIIEEGGKPAFPVNLSANNVAAHYTPKINDELEIQENDVLKIDIGVHVEGFIADCACTVDFSGKNQKLVEASEKALENALTLVKPGLEIGKIGEEIEKTIKSFGFNPVYNLSGHGLAKYETHAFPTIPN